MPDIKLLHSNYAATKLLLRSYKNVGVYCRVSTKSHSQINSLGNQLGSLVDYVASNPRWSLFDVYVDIYSGRSMCSRRSFDRLLADLKSGAVNLVVVKSISRLGRNTVDILSFLREMKKIGADVYFSEENYFASHENSELMVSMMSGIAQGESEDKSAYIKWGLNHSCVNVDSPIYNRPCYGYKKDSNGMLVIDTYEAEIVKKVFSLYLSGYSILKIQAYLKEEGVKSPRGKALWSKRSIETLLSNEKYAGIVYFRKSFIESYPESKRIVNEGQSEKYLASDHHEAIIPMETFSKVQDLKIERSNVDRDGFGGTRRKTTRYTTRREKNDIK